MPVPHGFTVTTEACTRYYEDGKTIAPEIEAEIFEYVAKLEADSGKRLGDKSNPLLVSVRSGARASMPGMMDTILNLGINDEVVEGIAELTQNPRFAYDTYRRFIQMFADVVAEVPKEYFERAIDVMKKKKGVTEDTELDTNDLKQLVEQFKALYKGHIGRDFPSDPKVQLMESVKAVFRSWDNPRAIYYRRQNGIPSSWGTAVTVQMMVFGNMGNDCGTGVAFTRNPATGEKKFFGEFPGQRPGRRCRGRYPHPQEHRRAQAAHAGGVRPVPGDRHPVGTPLQGHAGHGVHHRARQALHAADPQRQAHRPGPR